MKRLTLLLLFLAAISSCQKQVSVVEEDKDGRGSGITPNSSGNQNATQIEGYTWYIAESKSFIGNYTPFYEYYYSELMPDMATLALSVNSSGTADITINYLFPSFSSYWEDPNKTFSLVLNDLAMQVDTDGSLCIDQSNVEAAFYTKEDPFPISISRVVGRILGSHSELRIDGVLQMACETCGFGLKIGALTHNESEARFGRMPRAFVDNLEMDLCCLKNETSQTVYVSMDTQMPYLNRLGEGSFEIAPGQEAFFFIGEDFDYRRNISSIRVSMPNEEDLVFEKSDYYSTSFQGLSKTETRVYSIFVSVNHWDRQYQNRIDYVLSEETLKH